MLKGILKKKLNNDKGFTLAELLIVVAIIAILVAVSIPVFTSRLEEAKKSTDLANIRAAKAAAVNEAYTDLSADTTYHYDAENGKLVLPKDSNIKAYGKSTKNDSELIGKGTTAPKGKILAVTVTTDGKVTFQWIDPTATTTAAS